MTYSALSSNIGEQSQSSGTASKNHSLLSSGIHDLALPLDPQNDRVVDNRKRKLEGVYKAIEANPCSRQEYSRDRISNRAVILNLSLATVINTIWKKYRLNQDCISCITSLIRWCVKNCFQSVLPFKCARGPYCAPWEWLSTLIQIYLTVRFYLAVSIMRIRIDGYSGNISPLGRNEKHDLHLGFKCLFLQWL